MVKSGEPLALLIPDSIDRAAEIWVDGNDSLIVEGNKCKFSFGAYRHFSLVDGLESLPGHSALELF